MLRFIISEGSLTSSLVRVKQSRVSEIKRLDCIETIHWFLHREVCFVVAKFAILRRLVYHKAHYEPELHYIGRFCCNETFVVIVACALCRVFPVHVKFAISEVHRYSGKLIFEFSTGYFPLDSLYQGV